MLYVSAVASCLHRLREREYTSGCLGGSRSFNGGGGRLNRRRGREGGREGVWKQDRDENSSRPRRHCQKAFNFDLMLKCHPQTYTERRVG